MNYWDDLTHWKPHSNEALWTGGFEYCAFEVETASTLKGEMHPPSNFSYVKGRTWATVQNASQGSFCTKRRSWDHLFVFAFCSCIC